MKRLILYSIIYLLPLFVQGQYDYLNRYTLHSLSKKVITNDNKLVVNYLSAWNDIRTNANATVSGVSSTTAVGTSGLGSTAFSGGVLMPDGTVTLVPFSKGQVYKYDPVANTTTAVGTSGLGADAFIGGVLMPDGTVTLVPYSNGQVYKYDPGLYSKNFGKGTLLSKYLNKL